MNGIQHAEELPGLVSLTQRREGQHGPDRCVGVLATVFSNTGDVAFDIPWIPWHPIKGWRQQTDQPVLPVHKMAFNCSHGTRTTVRICCTADHPPRLRDRIDAAFRVCSGTERGPIIKVRAAVPLSVPPIPLDRSLQRTHMKTPRFSTSTLTALNRHLG